MRVQCISTVLAPSSSQMTNRHILVRLVSRPVVSAIAISFIVRYTRCSTDSLSFPSYRFFTKWAQELLTPYTTCSDGGQAGVLAPGKRNRDTNTFFATMWVGFCWKLAPLASIPILHFDLSCRWTACAGGPKWGRSFEILLIAHMRASQDSISMEQRY